MTFTNTIKRTYKRTVLSTALAVGLATASVAGFAGEYKDDARDAWLSGKLETSYLFNRHLNNFTIDVSVDEGTAYLSGKVQSETDRELAESIAMNVEGIARVENNLIIDREYDDVDNHVDLDYDKVTVIEDLDVERSFRQVVEDATTTAEIKTKLLANDNTGGLDINVDTRWGVVFLNGDVMTGDERELATEIAMEADDVHKVVNNLVIKPRVSQR